MIAAYIRVSTDKQKLDMQQDAIRDWAAAHAGGEPLAWFEDYASGADWTRRGWADCMAALESRACSALVTFDGDRIGRTKWERMAILGQMQQLGVRYIDLSRGPEPYDYDNSLAFVTESMKIAWAEEERRKIRARVTAGVRAAIKRKAERGETWGCPPKHSAEKIRKVTALIESGMTATEALKKVRVPKSVYYARRNKV